MSSPALSRSLGLGGAVLLGLGSIIGTGVFVSIGLAAGVAGGWVVLATLLAGLLAAANALSSAQLAAAHPVSGGTYEYGYRLLSPAAGFSAGWLFLCAKSASAATAALGVAGYALSALGPVDGVLRTAVAMASVVLVTALVLGGLRRTTVANFAIVGVALVALLAFVSSAAASVAADGAVDGAEPFRLPGLLEATALMFVAFTGYGRVATMGEEVRDPERTIPRAIIVTLIISGGLYAVVAFAAISAVGAETLAESTRQSGAPLEDAARAIGHGWVARMLAIGAMAAMLGVLLNLVLGLSRVVLAMARRGDLPTRLARVNQRGPAHAVVAVGVVIAGLAAIGSIEFAWSLSAVTVLVYYALTNLAALRLPPTHRLYPRWIAWVGLLGCVWLAWWVTPAALLAAVGLLIIGFGARALSRGPSSSPGAHRGAKGAN